jgi:hypothetical protein
MNVAEGETPGIEVISDTRQEAVRASMTATNVHKRSAARLATRRSIMDGKVEPVC